MFGAHKFKHGATWTGYNDPVTIAGITLAGVSTFQGYEARKEQAAAQRESSAAQGRMAEIDAQRQRVQQVREARIRRAQILASQGETGAGTSATVGGLSSVTTQVASNIGNINQTQGLAAAASAANQRAADAASSAANWEAFGNLVQAASPLQQNLTTIFGGNTFPKVGTTNKTTQPTSIFK